MRQMGQNDICEAGSGDAWYVRGSMSTQTWAVGTRYRLERVLGEACMERMGAHGHVWPQGSFSCVCLATCKATGEKADGGGGGGGGSGGGSGKNITEAIVLGGAICKLVDAFMTPSATGRLVYRGGQLVPASFDLYIALEYCNQGDLFHMRGQLVEADVKSVMWQLLGALRYMHSVHVWHRDIKSANILVTLEEGRRLVK
ncbi:kinase-like domain-containing protein, partial [Haematococcus lacustris]